MVIESRPTRGDSLYSPRRRTALVLTGTGTAGAYHAGALRALHEAGVKLDILGGCGVGTVAAAFGAVDGGARLWSDPGLWRGRRLRHYRWMRPFRAAGWAAATVAALLLVPIGWFLIAGAVLFVSFLLNLLGLPGGGAAAGASADFLTLALGSAELPARIPKLILVIVLALVTIITIGVVSDRSTGAGPSARRLVALVAGLWCSAQWRGNAAVFFLVAVGFSTRGSIRRPTGAGRDQPPVRGASHREPGAARVP